MAEELIEEIKRVELFGKRFYEVKHNGIVICTAPSVTSILGTTSDKSGLDRWRKRIGQEAADLVGLQSTNRGTVMHRLIELYLNTPCNLKRRDRLDLILELVSTDEELKPFDTRAILVGTQLFFNLFNTGFFDRIKHVHAQEKFLWNKILSADGEDLSYAGAVDNFSLMDDDINKIVDFKTAKKPKDEKYIEGYKMQTSAYAVAVWRRMGIKPMGTEIWISAESQTHPQCFMLNYHDIKRYFEMFIERRREFNKIIKKQDPF